MEIKTLEISQIRVSKRLRQVREEQISSLMESIGQIGLQQPISVRAKSFVRDDGVNFEDGYLLIAGLHRLEACRRLGKTEIEASIVTLAELDRQLWEIDENLCRAELTELERGEHLAKRKALYEMLHPETRQGGLPGKAGGGKETKTDNLSSFAEDTAAKIGADERTVRRSIRRADRIDPEVKEAIRTQPKIADSGVELDALASLKPQQQREAVAIVETGQAGSIREAKQIIQQEEPRQEEPQRETASELDNSEPSPPTSDWAKRQRERAAEAMASDRRVNALMEAIEKFTPNQMKRFAEWFDDYRKRTFGTPIKNA
ncbi:MAG: ParB N-terminal domain-containing protein [Alphaproteobacteria bacterium]|nr:ParB N-terminal domain-containing protein [Alphaproteobacteria bacterium]